MSEAFDLDAYLRCDCASVGNQTCDKCVLLAHIATLQREADGMREALAKIAANAPTEFQDWPGGGTAEDEYLRGIENQHFALAHIARAALNGSEKSDV